MVVHGWVLWAFGALCAILTPYILITFQAHSSVLDAAVELDAEIVSHQLRSYAREATVETPMAPCKVAFCCGVDLDVAVNATNLLELLLKDVDTSIEAQHYEKIHSIKAFAESFGFFFSKGAAAEQTMVG